MMQGRLLKLLGMVMVGEGLLLLLYPQRYVNLWRRGPEWLREAIDVLDRNPKMTRTIGGLEAALGLWLATRQLPR